MGLAATTSTIVRISAFEIKLFLLLVYNYLRKDVRQLKLNKESARRRRYRYLAEERGKIRKDYIDLMVNKMLVVHFEVKIIKHIEEDS